MELEEHLDAFYLSQLLKIEEAMAFGQQRSIKKQAL
jgi:hypothetical protein